MSTQQGGARQGVFLNLKNAVSTLAGKAGVSGAADGSATRASFDAPKGITTDGYFLYVADWNNHTIRKVDAVSGVVTTIAGMAGMKGSSDGTGTAARFNRPYGITTDGINLYVTDSNNHCIRKIDIESAAVTTLAGAAGEVGYSDGAANQARFFIPEGITTDGANLYVADTHNHSVRKIELESGIVTTLAGLSGSPGFSDGAGMKARFSYPKGITTDGRNLYVVDFGNHRVRKIAIASAGVTTLAGGKAMTPAAAVGSGGAIPFNYPTGITSDGRNLYVADTFNRTVRKIVIASGIVTTIAGKADLPGSADGIGSEARFKDPVGITSDGNCLYVTDSANHTVRKVR
ncbi:MAG TPA: hypothetical protein VMV48_07435 [Gallionellaceae bacterium]|nr:hypothetical protein [Gallionellaceae bacterium]